MRRIGAACGMRPACAPGQAALASIRGARILLVPAAFTLATTREHWEILLRARAIETGCFVLAPAQCGTHPAPHSPDRPARRSHGHSLVVDPWGRVLADAGGAEPGIILAEIDLARVAEARARIPSLQHGRPFTIERVSSQAQAAHQAAQQATE